MARILEQEQSGNVSASRKRNSLPEKLGEAWLSCCQSQIFWIFF
jgi:hypothetical protein